MPRAAARFGSCLLLAALLPASARGAVLKKTHPFVRGLIAYVEAQDAAARRHFRRVPGRDPFSKRAREFTALYKFIADVEKGYLRSGQQYEELEDFPRAFRSFATGLAANPDSKPLLVGAKRVAPKLESRAVTALTNEISVALARAEGAGQRTAAIGHLRAILVLDPDRSQIEGDIRAQHERLRAERLKEELDNLFRYAEELFAKHYHEEAGRELSLVLFLKPDEERAMEMRRAVLFEMAKEREELGSYFEERTRRGALQRYYDLALAFWEKDQYAKALKEFRLCLDLDPGNKTVMANIAHLEDAVARVEEQKRKIQEEKARYNVDIARRMAEAGDAASALQSAMAAAAADPNNAEAYRILQRFAKEAKHSDRYQVGPHSPYHRMTEAFLDSAESKAKRKRWGEAVEDASQVLAVFPENRRARAVLKKAKGKERRRAERRVEEIGRERAYAGDRTSTRALRDFLREINSGNTNLDTAAGRGLEIDMEEAHSARVREQFVIRGNNLFRERNYREALAAYEQARKLDPFDFQVVRAIKKTERYLALAMNRLEESEDSRKVRSLYFRGLTAYSEGRYREALVLWRRVLKLRPGHEKARVSIQRCESKIRLMEAQG